MQQQRPSNVNQMQQQQQQQQQQVLQPGVNVGQLPAMGRWGDNPGPPYQQQQQQQQQTQPQPQQQQLQPGMRLPVPPGQMMGPGGMQQRPQNQIPQALQQLLATLKSPTTPQQQKQVGDSVTGF